MEQALERPDLSALTDDQLLQHISARVSDAIQVRLTDLQARNSEGLLSADELAEFDRLLLYAHEGALLRAWALLEWKERHGKLPPGFELLTHGAV